MSRETVTVKNKDNIRALARATTEFAIDLYKVISSKVADGENIFFSPYSITTALSMIQAGSGGNTLTQMQNGLKLHEDLIKDNKVHEAYEDLLSYLLATTDVELHTANRAYAGMNFKLLESYTSLLTKSYKSDILNTDFSNESVSRAEINKWVEGITKDKIKDLIKPGVLTVDTKLVLVNAVYFKGNWLSKFDKEVTRAEPFYRTSENPIQVHMMRDNRKFYYGELEDLDCKILTLPYSGSKFAMTLILPMTSGPAAIKLLESNLRTENLERAYRASGIKTKVDVAIPRFKIEFGSSLNEAFRALGIVDLFDAMNADLSGINGGKGLFVSEVIHKAFVEVNEDGTEAAAATAGVMMYRMAPIDEPKEFIADRPFLFFISDLDTNIVLFVGKLVDPPIAE